MTKAYPLFSVVGIELEYMIVDENTLNVKPIADKLFYDQVGSFEDEIKFNEIGWSNELVAHVVEIKNILPSATLQDLDETYHQHIQKINNDLKKYQAKLLPTGAHPWMNPETETRLWPHGDKEIYEAYNRIFNCQGHGWSNLQSVHLNLPFATDSEFEKLHSAIRLLLPIIPALTASTPIIEGAITGYCDTRLFYYGKNQQNIPPIAGNIIPEHINSKKTYEKTILEPMYQAIASFDTESILQEEWLNSRAAIPKFERHSMEIRIIDIQESPKADMACVAAIIACLKGLGDKAIDISQQVSTDYLRTVYDTVVLLGGKAILDSEYLAMLGLDVSKGLTAKDAWSKLIEKNTNNIVTKYQNVLEHILSRGNLSERLTNKLPNNFKHADLFSLYQDLSDCLKRNNLFS